MSDFLSRMVDRARGTVAAVVPRLPSRFEPDPAVPLLRPDAGEEAPPPEPVMAAGDGALPGPVPDAGEARPTPARPGATRATGDDQDGSRRVRVLPAEPSDTRRRPPAYRADGGDAPAQPDGESEARPDRGRRDGAAVSLRSDGPAARPAPEQPPPRDGFARRSRTPPAAPVLVRRDAHAGDRPEPADRGVLVPARPAADPLEPGPVAPAAPSRWAGGDGPPAGGATTTEAVVNVTIGRIEVRAVPGSQTRREPARRGGPKPLGLEEYLQRRGAGR